MFHSTTKQYLDTMFVIISVIAGANSLDVSNNSKHNINQFHGHLHRASFIDIVLDYSRFEPHESTSNINDMLDQQHSGIFSPDQIKQLHRGTTVCKILSPSFNHIQMKFCLKHRDILVNILPKVIHLTRRECIKITQDLKWNCPTISSLLDRSNPLGKC